MHQRPRRHARRRRPDHRDRQRGPRQRLRAQVPDVAPGRYVMVAVSDTGTGMDEATREHAFDPFFTTKAIDKGSGLGLSMVYGFIKQSRGHVRIYSEPGHGTTVRLYLPYAEGDADPVAVAGSEEAVPTGTEQVLVVEDDDLLRDHVVDQLTGLGYRVIATRNGPEALEVIRTRDDLDLLFTDIVMPGGMSGRDLADAALELRPTLPVLFTSGYTRTPSSTGAASIPACSSCPSPTGDRNSRSRFAGARQRH
ncbi:MAG: ATP-binding protein [Gammaproteobacteria bacterium]|nr:ATP-binding protein [Gammaproteobacteria bacterium]